jgi:hypothetical protein
MSWTFSPKKRQQPPTAVIHAKSRLLQTGSKTVNDLKEKALVQVDMGYLRKEDQVMLIRRKDGETTLFYMAEVIRDGYYVKQEFGFRDIGGEHQKDRYVDVQIAGAWLESILWRSEGWEVWTSPKIRDRISIDALSNDRLRQKREDDREKALDAERENADKMNAIREREEKKRELLRQVEVLNAAIKALD